MGKGCFFEGKTSGLAADKLEWDFNGKIVENHHLNKNMIRNVVSF